MRGKFFCALFCLGLIAAAPGLRAAQVQVQFNGQPVIIQQDRTLVDVLSQAYPAGQSQLKLAPEGDLLQFVDGSMMHGGLKQMDTASGLRWANPMANKPIDLSPTHIDSIRFSHASPVHLNPTARLRFVNGDDLFGSVVSLDNEHLGFSTWFGRALAIPRACVQSITFLSSNYTILYDGPGDTDGWIIGSHNPDSWILRDGVFTSGSPGPLGRDFKLVGSSTIEFDLAWNEAFELAVNIYSDAVDHLDFGNSYLLEFRRDEVDMRHVDSNRQFPLSNLGSAPIPYTTGKNKMHVTIQSNKEEGTVAVFIDDVLVKRWKDESGFRPSGGGVLFQMVEPTGAIVKLSNILVSQWEGRFEPETTAIATNTDAIRFINRDHATGKITGIAGGKVALTLGEASLEIPIQRVTQINFAQAAATAPATTPDAWQVRAHFPGGGTLSFQLKKWNDQEIEGQSPFFGAVAFAPGQIRRLEFNLGHPNAASPAVIDNEFEGLDE
jgi:hypothetical protein